MGIEDEVRGIVEGKDNQNEKLKRILERIKNGESTGDPLKDLLLVHHEGKLDAEMEKKYRRVQEKINAHPKEQILVTYTDHHRIQEGGCMGSALYREATHYMQLGIIKNTLSIDVAKEKIIIPTNGYVYKGDWLWRDRCDEKHWQKDWGNVTISAQFMTAFYHNINFRFHLPSLGVPSAKEVNIMVGDTEVELYFNVGRDHFNQFQDYELALEQRNASEKEWQEHRDHVTFVKNTIGKRDKRQYVDYVQGLNLLKQEKK